MKKQGDIVRFPEYSMRFKYELLFLQSEVRDSEIILHSRV